jgi:hypothetical protein
MIASPRGRSPSGLLQRISSLRCVKPTFTIAAVRADYTRTRCHGTNKFNNIEPILARQHWLSLASRSDCKVSLLTFTAVTLKQPEYLSELVHFAIPARQLRSVSRNLLQASDCKIVFAACTFFHATSAVWNNLPRELTHDISSNVDKRRTCTLSYSTADRQSLSPVRDCDSSLSPTV